MSHARNDSCCNIPVVTWLKLGWLTAFLNSCPLNFSPSTPAATEKCCLVPLSKEGKAWRTTQLFWLPNALQDLLCAAHVWLFFSCCWEAHLASLNQLLFVPGLLSQSIIFQASHEWGKRLPEHCENAVGSCSARTAEGFLLLKSYLEAVLWDIILWRIKEIH